MTTEEMIEIPKSSLDRIHERNRKLDGDVQMKDKEIEILSEAFSKLLKAYLQVVKHGV